VATAAGSGGKVKGKGRKGVAKTQLLGDGGYSLCGER